MGGLNVKITMIQGVLQVIAPHPCSGCAKIGTILCLDCKYNITHESFFGCILCGRPQLGGICPSHDSPIQRAFTVGSRTGPLEDVINRLKFQNTKLAARTLAELLNESLPFLPSDIQIVPIPTVRSHIRQRGYDQVELIAQHLAALRSMSIKRALLRKTNETQHIVRRNERLEQSQRAFSLMEGTAFGSAPILLLDDIVTTGSTVSAAAQLLKEAGATVWVATLAYQPLD
ncbi:MAG: ComF family protein [Candidatus Saccharimonadaceae bacterium]